MNIHKLSSISIILTSFLMILAGYAQNLKIHSCSYIPIYLNNSPQMGLPQPPLTDWEYTLISYFNAKYGHVLPKLPILTLYHEQNARAGAFGVALNRQWMLSLGKPMATAILAHELGHVCQGYHLLPMDEPLAKFGVEGQADYFAGRLLSASGFPQEIFESFVIPLVLQNQGSNTHPPGQIRAMLMKAGFYY